MIREFQIWSQSSNRITFDPLWPKKRSKTAKIDFLLNSDFFWPKKQSRMLSDLNFETRFGILSSFNIF